MPNNRRGFGGKRDHAWIDANGNWLHTTSYYDMPTSTAGLWVGDLWRDGTSVKILAPEDTELLLNPGFESGTDDWDIDGSVTAYIETSPESVIEGQALQLIFSDQKLGVCQDVSLTDDHCYYFSANVLLPYGGVAIIKVMDQYGNLLAADCAGNPGWNLLEVMFQADGTDHAVMLGSASDDLNSTWDNISLREVLMS